MRDGELGVRIGTGEPGGKNAITDVAGVRVGHATLIEGEDVRTGVTVVFPHEGDPGRDPVFAGCHRLNGNGELTGHATIEATEEAIVNAMPQAETMTGKDGATAHRLDPDLLVEVPRGTLKVLE
jgi:D-aminopeptidase